MSLSTLSSLSSAGSPTPPATPPVTPPPSAPLLLSLNRARLPRWAPWLAAINSGAASGLVTLTVGLGIVGWVMLATAIHAIALPAWSYFTEGPRTARDRLATIVIWVSFAVALVPLVSLLWKVIGQGAGAIDVEFLTYSMRNVVGAGGGIYHALLGTLLITLGAGAISIPVAVLAAIYLVEYGAGSRTARVLTFLVDVMTGIPSVVAGLFAYALFVLFFGEGVRLGIGGSVALSLLMIPVVVRSTEEMLKLVPHELREAAYALGVAKWRVVVRVVLPTSMAGIITGITLAVARVIGETAPLLVIAGATDSVNLNLFAERMMTLPVYIYYSYTQPGVPASYGQERAWGAALVLIVIVIVLNMAARGLGRKLNPKTRQRQRSS